MENTYYGFIKRVFVLLKPPNDVIGNLQQGIENKPEVANVPLQSNQSSLWFDVKPMTFCEVLPSEQYQPPTFSSLSLQFSAS